MTILLVIVLMIAVALSAAAIFRGESDAHARMRISTLAARSGTKHCLSDTCMYSLPHPDEWVKYGWIDPECFCPCLGCHARDVSYDAALDVVRVTKGERRARELEEERRKALSS